MTLRIAAESGLGFGHGGGLLSAPGAGHDEAKSRVEMFRVVALAPHFLEQRFERAGACFGQKAAPGALALSRTSSL